MDSYKHKLPDEVQNGIDKWLQEDAERMNGRKMVYCCWRCNKEYPSSIYPPFDQQDKLVLCDKCGHQVVSRSGKVMMKFVKI